MNQVLTQLSLPTIVSVAGLIATYAWYQQAIQVKGVRSSGPPVAVLELRQDVIERRPTTRLIWQPLEAGELLFSGEAVRTSAKSSARIKFLKSGVTVGIEPESVVTIEEADGKLALNLVNGGMFVKQEHESGGSSKAGDQPVIKAGERTLALSGNKAEMNLSLGSSGQANVVVSKGQVTLDGRGGASTLKEGTIQSISSQSTSVTAIDLVDVRPNAVLNMTSQDATFLIRWKPLKDSRIKSIAIEMGPTRDARQVMVQGMSPSSTEAKVKPLVGDFFWRVVGKDNAGKIVAESPQIFNSSLMLEAPVRLTPKDLSTHLIAAKEASSSSGTDRILDMSWSRPKGAEGILLSVARDREFKNKVFEKRYSVENATSLNLSLEGRYFWRLVAFWPGQDKGLASTVGEFSVARKAELPRPTLLSPNDRSVVTLQQLQSQGQLFTWSQDAENLSYVLLLEFSRDGKSWAEFKRFETSMNQLRVKDLTEGFFRWSVQAKREQDASKFSESRFVKTLSLPLLDLSQISEKIFYPTGDDLLVLVIAGVPSDAKRVRYRVFPEGAANLTPAWQPALLDGRLVIKNAQKGFYEIEAEALDLKDKTLAVSKRVKFEIKELEKLPPPVLKASGREIQASPQGQVQISWNEIKGATKVTMILTLQSGQKINREYAPNLSPILKGLSPGVHRFILTAIDKKGRVGEPSLEYLIKVPDVSDVAAPKAKGLKVR